MPEIPGATIYCGWSKIGVNEVAIRELLGEFNHAVDPERLKLTTISQFNLK
ncbi:hypothetical protein MYX84_03240 [Acidobacteria bacterium AH-259-O06]|nr:hypothetical protein [Acidobacteria bacterium AH-259-O06]